MLTTLAAWAFAVSAYAFARSLVGLYHTRTALDVYRLVCVGNLSLLLLGLSGAAFVFSVTSH